MLPAGATGHLADLLDNSTLPTESGARYRIVTPTQYAWSRIALHAPFIGLAVAGLVFAFLRSASRGRTEWFVVGIVIGVPIVIIAVVIGPAASKGPQICVVSLPIQAKRLLGLLSSPNVPADAGGRVPRYRLLATDDGIALGPPLRGDGVLSELMLLQSNAVSLDLGVTSRGRIATCVLSKAGERADLAVRGRLALKAS